MKQQYGVEHDVQHPNKHNWPEVPVISFKSQETDNNLLNYDKEPLPLAATNCPCYVQLNPWGTRVRRIVPITGFINENKCSDLGVIQLISTIGTPPTFLAIITLNIGFGKCCRTSFILKSDDHTTVWYRVHGDWLLHQRERKLPREVVPEMFQIRCHYPMSCIQISLLNHPLFSLTQSLTYSDSRYKGRCVIKVAIFGTLSAYLIDLGTTREELLINNSSTCCSSAVCKSKMTQMWHLDIHHNDCWLLNTW